MQSISGEGPNHKNRCPDCKMCLRCSENRCAACQSGSHKTDRIRMSIREQIALYERLNPQINLRSEEKVSLSSSCQCGHLDMDGRDKKTEYK